MVHRYPPSVGGTQILAYNIAQGLRKKGHFVKVYTSSHQNQPDFEVREGTAIRRFKLKPHFLSRFLKHPRYITPKMIPYLLSSDAQDIDIIHSFGYCTFQSLLANALGKLRNTPCFLTPQYHPWGTVYANTAGIKVIKSATKNIAQCESEFKALSRFIKESKIQKIPTGIDSSRFLHLPEHNLKEKLDITNEKIILSVGKLASHKGTETLIKAIHKLRHKFNTNVKCLLIGGGERIGEYKNFAKRLGIHDNVIFMGRVDSETLLEAYAAADVFVLSSLHESFGITLVEAAACGKPIVSTRVGVAFDLIKEGNTGFFCNRSDPDDFAKKIIKIMEDDRFSENARNHRNSVLANYDWSNIFDKTEEIYLSTL
jgi:glycosyltransferase involved in cell wall biosynthesis